MDEQFDESDAETVVEAEAEPPADDDPYPKDEPPALVEPLPAVSSPASSTSAGPSSESGWSAFNHHACVCKVHCAVVLQSLRACKSSWRSKGCYWRALGATRRPL